MIEFIFTIEGQPVSQARHRTCMRGGFAMQYDPCAAHKKLIRYELNRQMLELQCIRPEDCKKLMKSESLSIELLFEMKIPPSFSKKKRTLALSGEITPQQTDYDNLAKLVGDAANGILWSDDRVINKALIEKKYSENPKTTIKIFNENLDEKK